MFLQFILALKSKYDDKKEVIQYRSIHNRLRKIHKQRFTFYSIKIEFQYKMIKSFI